ncbi:unnamed protein product [Mortierella alpina]
MRKDSPYPWGGGTRPKATTAKPKDASRKGQAAKVEEPNKRQTDEPQESRQTKKHKARPAKPKATKRRLAKEPREPQHTKRHKAQMKVEHKASLPTASSTPTRYALRSQRSPRDDCRGRST